MTEDSYYKLFTMQFVKNHPRFLKNPMYVTGISYSGIIIPIITEELYKGIQYLICILHYLYIQSNSLSNLVTNIFYERKGKMI